MSDMDPGLSLYISMLSITAVTGVMAAGHSQVGLGSGGGKIPYFQYVFPTPIVTRHRYSVVSRRHYSVVTRHRYSVLSRRHCSAVLNIPGCY